MKEEAIQWNNKGVQHFLKEEWELAAEYFKKAKMADSDNPAVWNNMGLLAHQKKEYSQAVDFFQHAIGLEKKPTYFVNKGNAFAMQGKHEEAQSCYQKALELDPKSEEGLLSNAKLHIHLNEYQEGLIYLEKLVGLYQKPAHYYDLAVIYLQLGKASDALEILYRLAENQPSALIWFQIGRGEFFSKNHGIAEKFFKKALAEMPDHKSFRHYLALNYLTTGNVGEGLRQLDLVLKLYPDDYEILTEKGVVLCGMDDFQGALDCFSKALEINSEFAKAIQYRDLVVNNHKETR